MSIQARFSTRCAILLGLASILPLLVAVHASSASTLPERSGARSRAARSASYPGINLSWDDCGLAGTSSKSFACNSNDRYVGALVGSFVPPPNVNEFLGISAGLTIASSTATLPDWWQFGSFGECRGTSGGQTSFDFIVGPFSCVDAYSGQAAGGFAYEVGYGGPDRARLRIQAAIPSDSPVPLDSTTEYYAFKFVVLPFKTVGAGSCSGCDVPVTISLDSLRLFQPLEVGYDPLLKDPVDGNVVYWQGNPLSPTPRIDSFTPLEGGDGTPVTIFGRYLTGATSVRFGTLEASFSVASDSVIGATAPTGVQTSRITVTTPDGTATSSASFLVGPEQGHVDLAWNDCGAAGDSLQTFACTTNTGTPFVLIGSFVPPPNIEKFLGAAAEIRVVSSTPDLPDWWKLGTGQCRGTSGLSASFDFRGGPFTCRDFQHGNATGSYSYEVGYYGNPASARLRVNYAIPADSAGPLDPGSEYYAFNVGVTRAQSTGTGSCAGCDVPVTLTLDQIQLFQSPELQFDPVLFRPLVGKTVRWQVAPPEPLPVIYSFDPTSGTAGTPVSVRGLHFTGATSVRFGSLEAAFTVPSDTVIDAIAPAGVQTSPIRVTTPAGTATSPGFFQVAGTSSPGINLSWDDCGTAGNMLKTFACDASSGEPFALLASYLPPANVDRFVGLSAQVDITSSTPALPDWWKFGTSACRGLALSASADFTTGPLSCADFWAGRGVGGWVYDIGFGTPDRARLLVQFAVPVEDQGPLYTGVEYYGFKVLIQRSKTTGTGSCAGCDVPTCIVLNSIQLFQPPDANFDPVITNPQYRNFVAWQRSVDCPVSTPVQVALVSAEALQDRVHIVWQTHDVDVATVYRREGAGTWAALANVPADGLHRIDFEDRAVTPGTTYRYRLGIRQPGGEEFFGETEVAMPAPDLALSAVSWDRSAGALRVSFSLPRAGSAALEVYDLTGRRVAGHKLEGLTAGSHQVTLGEASLRSGIYFGRLTQDDHSAMRKFMVVK